MALLVDIAFVPAPFEANAAASEQFYLSQLKGESNENQAKKLRYLQRKSGINSRTFAIPDISTDEKWLYSSGEIIDLEKRMQLFNDLSARLANAAVAKLLERNPVSALSITHLITVSCTGQSTPGLEWTLSRQWNWESAEKFPLNFLGCHAGLKAISLAKQLADNQPDACVIIVAVELSSLHFFPAKDGESMVPNVLFADGAAAALVTSKPVNFSGKPGFQIIKSGNGFIPDTAGFMTWNLSSNAFRMYLSPDLVKVIEKNVAKALLGFLDHPFAQYSWAVHPGGIKILDAVEKSCGLPDGYLATSREVYARFGNMSSVTILAILAKMMEEEKSKTILGLAFGPGVSMEFCLLQPAG